VHSICKVSIYKSVVTLRAKLMRTELLNSRYSRYVIASGYGLAIFNSTLILPFSGWEVWASEATWEEVRSESSMK